MKRNALIFLLLLSVTCCLNGQVLNDSDTRILFHGLVVDATTMKPVEGSQIMVNRVFVTITDKEGKFAFNVNRNDTLVFSMLGYRPAVFQLGDTLSGKEFIAGIYLYSDTLEIPEVVIIPRYSDLRSEIFTSRPETSQIMENAKYNLEVSSYQGRVTQGRLGDPTINYEVLRQQQRSEAYSRGQIPSDRIVGLSPFMILPAAYLLMNGLPGKPVPLRPQLTEKEVDDLHKKYMEKIRKTQ